MDVKPLETFHQLATSTLPLEGARLAVREFLVEEEALFDFRETREVVRRQDLALPEGEGNVHLIEPTGMNWRVHHQQIGVSRAKRRTAASARYDLRGRLSQRARPECRQHLPF